MKRPTDKELQRIAVDGGRAAIFLLLKEANRARASEAALADALERLIEEVEDLERAWGLKSLEFARGAIARAEDRG